MATYAMISTADSSGYDSEGNIITIPSGTVVNLIAWDGIAEYTPPDGTRLEASETLQIGDMAP